MEPRSAPVIEELSDEEKPFLEEHPSFMKEEVPPVGSPPYVPRGYASEPGSETKRKMAAEFDDELSSAGIRTPQRPSKSARLSAGMLFYVLVLASCNVVQNNLFLASIFLDAPSSPPPVSLPPRFAAPLPSAQKTEFKSPSPPAARRASGFLPSSDFTLGSAAGAIATVPPLFVYIFADFGFTILS